MASTLNEDGDRASEGTPLAADFSKRKEAVFRFTEAITEAAIDFDALSLSLCVSLLLWCFCFFCCSCVYAAVQSKCLTAIIAKEAKLEWTRVMSPMTRGGPLVVHVWIWYYKRYRNCELSLLLFRMGQLDVAKTTATSYLMTRRLKLEKGFGDFVGKKYKIFFVVFIFV